MAHGKLNADKKNKNNILMSMMKVIPNNVFLVIVSKFTNDGGGLEQVDKMPALLALEHS